MNARPAPPNEKLPRYNHYVPKFILENFADNGQLSIFDKHTLRQFKLPPYRAMGERDFNNVVVEDGVLSFENRFTHLEDLAAPVISQIVSQKSLLDLTPMQVATLHTFVVTQLLRSKRRRMDQALVTSEIKKRWPDVEVNPLKESMADNDFEKFFSLEFAFKNLNELTSALVPKHSFLMVKACEGELYISDNPMVMHNSKDYGPYGNILSEPPFPPATCQQNPTASSLASAAGGGAHAGCDASSRQHRGWFGSQAARRSC